MKIWFFESINTIDKPLARWTKEKERRYKSPVSGVKQEISLQTLQTSTRYKRIV